MDLAPGLMWDRTQTRPTAGWSTGHYAISQTSREAKKALTEPDSDRGRIVYAWLRGMSGSAPVVEPVAWPTIHSALRGEADALTGRGLWGLSLTHRERILLQRHRARYAVARRQAGGLDVALLDPMRDEASLPFEQDTP